jgi:hypothetical protein
VAPAAPAATPALFWGRAWHNNPQLPEAQGYPGDSSYQATQYPDAQNWTPDINIAVTERQMLLVHGSKARIPDGPTAGGLYDCFLLVAQGPLSGTVQLRTASVEVHEVDPDDRRATALTWAAQKVKDMRAAHPATCGQDGGMDVWIGQ